MSEQLIPRITAKGPKKILALDGGGIRGIITIEVLVRMEEMLAGATQTGSAFRLCDFFDYIGGTSTGAIIAAGLARGMSATELLAFYKKTGPAMFKKSFLPFRFFQKFTARPLTQQLQETFGADTTLFPEHLRCLLLAVTHNTSTDFFWPVSSNPHAKYNDPKRTNCNLKVPLWQLVRASTAAPTYFPPEVIHWDPADPSQEHVFEDGGITPYNNPSFLLYRMATLPQYRLRWKTGERDLLLISIGTGAAPRLDARIRSMGRFLLSNARLIPPALMYGAQVDQDINCRTVGRCVYGARIDSELEDMIPKDAQGQGIPITQDLGKAFLYARYNADLSKKGLTALGFSDMDPERVGKLDAVAAMDDLSRIGQKLAEEVKLEHFGSFVGMK